MSINPLVIELLKKLEAAQRERDLLTAQLSVATERAALNHDRATAAEAELQRRDEVDASATRGMPDYEIFIGHKVFEDGEFRITDMVELSVLQRQQEITRQLAVESNRLTDEKRALVEELQRRDAQEPVATVYKSERHARVMMDGGLPQGYSDVYGERVAAPAPVPDRVVRLPARFKPAISTIFSNSIPVMACNTDGWWVNLQAVLSALNDAGVKWVEGE